jgi:hypothetical protein
MQTVKDWVGHATAGDCVVYYRGDLGHDAGFRASAWALRQYREHVFAFAAAGLVDLVQVRVRDGHYLYFMIRRARPHDPPIAFRWMHGRESPLHVPPHLLTDEIGFWPEA